MIEQANGHATTHAPGDESDEGVTLHWRRDRPGGKIVVIAKRAGQVLATERLDVFSDREHDKLAKAWRTRVGVRVNLLRDWFREIAGQVHEADQQPEPEPEPAAASNGGQGQELALSWPEPWPEPVNLADVLDEVEAAILRYVWIGEHQAAAAALWTCLTYHVDKFDVAPILMVSSPIKRCGKTTLGRVLAAMLPRVLAASSITPAALFRTIEQAKPTLLIDEADAFLAGSEELRGLLNAGHTRDTAYVIRTVGDDHEPRQFCVFGAKLLLGIGRLAPTIEDRSIILSLERKPPGAGVARLTRQALADLRQIGQRLMRWAVDHGEQIDPDADPATPDALNDRQADCWRPLLHLAELAGGDWPRRARAAAVALSAGRDADHDELPIRLLADLRTVFDADGRDSIPTTELLDALCRIEDAPWATLNRGRPITPHKLGKLLGSFGVRPRHTRSGNTYSRADLLPAWERYVAETHKKSPDPPDESFTPSHDDANHYEVRI
jgi:hypothetical protein